MASEQELNDVLARWHGRPAEARETVTRLERIARDALRERNEARLLIRQAVEDFQNGRWAPENVLKALSVAVRAMGEDE